MKKERKYTDILSNILRNYKKSFKLLIQVDKKFLFISSFFVILTGIMPAVSVKITQSLINGLQTKTYTLTKTITILSIYILLNIVISILTLCNQYYTSLFQLKLDRHINILILEKAGTLSFRSYENAESYNKIQRAQNSNRIYSFFSYLLTIAQLIITFCSYIMILLSWRWWVIIIIIITALISTLMLNKINKYRYEMLRKRTEKEREKWYYSFLLTNDLAYKEIRTYNLASYFIEKYQKIYSTFLKDDKIYLKKSAKNNFFISILDELCSGGIFLLIILDTYMGKILLGDSVAYINVTNNVKSTVKQLLLQSSSIYNDNLYINQLFEFLDMPEERVLLLPEKDINNFNTIDIKNMCYKYHTNSNYALKNINLQLKKGSLIAIVGQNGSGKSTLVKILAALYDDYTGSIKINGIEMKQINKSSLRRQISILFQDFSKYELSLKENIAISNIKNISDTKNIKGTIKDVDLTIPIELEQQLGNWFNNGKQLSGGEWIKIGIGRALFKNSNLFILDEPNAALDSMTEITIFNNIKSAIKNKIGLIITHRISNVPFYADQVLVLDKGEILGFDTHEQLLKTCPLYKELYKADLKLTPPSK